MTDDPRFSQMAEDVSYLRTRFDQHLTATAERDRELEGRLTKVEVRSGLWGLIGGLLSGAGIHFGKGS